MLVSKPLLAPYPWPMRRVFLALLLFAGLLLLPGCSNAQAEACDDAKSLSANYLNKASEFREAFTANKKINPSLAGHYYLLANTENIQARKIFVDNPSCFSSEQVVEAQLIVEKNRKTCELARDESADSFEKAQAAVMCVQL